MALKDSFYAIISSERSSDSLLTQIKINPEHTIFDGHFPNNPVTPGVVQLEIIKELVSDFIGRKVNLHTLSNSKFLVILNPTENAIVDIKLNITEVDEDVKVSGQITTPTEVGILKIAAVYR